MSGVGVDQTPVYWDGKRWRACDYVPERTVMLPVGWDCYRNEAILHEVCVGSGPRRELNSDYMQSGSDSPSPGSCTLPPEGWYCSLPEGHGGSCPTWPVTEHQWRRRALEAEDALDRLCQQINEENGPTHMGEPVLAAVPTAQGTEPCPTCLGYCGDRGQTCAERFAEIAAEQGVQAMAWHVSGDTEHWVTMDKDEAERKWKEGCKVRSLVFSGAMNDLEKANKQLHAHGKAMYAELTALRRALAEYPAKNPQQMQARKVCAGVLKMAEGMG